MNNTVTVVFDQNELTALAQALDVAVKATGIQGAKTVMPILAKLEAAVAEVNAAQNVAASFEDRDAA